MKKFLAVFIDNSSIGPEVDVSLVTGENIEEATQKVWDKQCLEPDEVDEDDYYIESISEVEMSSSIKYIN
tara:strand:+ start:1949 stop:2158 length:210 start_codon:yes stop_codon:yes gene_type:complete